MYLKPDDVVGWAHFWDSFHVNGDYGRCCDRGCHPVTMVIWSDPFVEIWVGSEQVLESAKRKKKKKRFDYFFL